MADEEIGAGDPPEPGGEENPGARKKSAGKKKAPKTEAPKTEAPKTEAPKTEAGPAACNPASPAANASAKPKAAPPQGAKPEAAPPPAATTAATGGASSYGESSEGESRGSGFLALWGPATMLVLVVLIFRFMGGDHAGSALSGQGAAQPPAASGQRATDRGSSGDLNQLDATPESGSNWSSPGGIMDAIRSATPDQITAALQAARSAIERTPGDSPSADAGSPTTGSADGPAAPAPQGGFANPWAPTGSEPWVTGAEPPPPPGGQAPYAAQQPGYPPAMPPQGYAQYGWQPMPPQGYGPPPPGPYPPQGYPVAPPQGAYPQQPYWGHQPYAGPPPYAGPQPYGGQQPYPPPGY